MTDTPGVKKGAATEFGVKATTPFRTQQSEAMPTVRPSGGVTPAPAGNTRHTGEGS